MKRAVALPLALAFAACGAAGGGNGPPPPTGDPNAQHCVDALNGYRAQAGAPPLVLDATLSKFAAAGSQQLHDDGLPHQHFKDANAAGTLFTSGFCSGAAENQAPGWSFRPDENGAVDAILAAMMAEGPGGGHHDNILNPQYHLVGVGLLAIGNQLWLTNDFSPPCP